VTQETRARVVLAAGAAVAGLLLSEVALRLIGFSYVIAPQGVEFGWPNPKVMQSRYKTDPDLFWVTNDYAAKLDHLRQGRPDLIFMGDSCTEFGGYPAEFLKLARAAHPGGLPLAEQVGVSGYTSLQGLRQLQRDVAPLSPRVVTLFYGWNDHWLGFGVEDDQVQWVTHSWLARMDRLRLGQLLVKTWMAASAGRRSTWPRRVPPDDFRRNLREMAQVAAAHGILAVLLTAPTSHRVGHEPRHLAERWLKDVGELVPLHARYADMVREAGAATGLPVCDVARKVEALTPEERAADFMSDGIHFTDSGNKAIAAMLLDCFETEPALRAALD